MPFPQDFDALKLAGYRFDNHARCRGCNAEVEWWFTQEDAFQPHGEGFESCRRSLRYMP